MKYDLITRTVGGIDYKAQGEVLPSGTAVFTFALPLPGRTPVVSVPEEIVLDIVKDAVVEVEYDPDLGISISLDLTEVQQDPEDPRALVGFQAVSDEQILEIIMDFVVMPCDNCSGFHFGDDVVPEVKALPAATKKKPPTYLN